MKGRRRIRFSLVSLLLATTATVLLFGLLQSRRRSMLQQEQALRTDGVQFFVERDWRDELWLSWPDNAIITVSKWQGRYKIGESLYNLEDAQAHCRMLQERLKNLGVENIRIRYQNSNGSGSILSHAKELKQFR